jgi:hypothetical protein
MAGIAGAMAAGAAVLWLGSVFLGVLGWVLAVLLLVRVLWFNADAKRQVRALNQDTKQMWEKLRAMQKRKIAGNKQ